MTNTDGLTAIYDARLRLVEALAPYVDARMKLHVGLTWLDQVRNARHPEAAPSCFDEATDVKGLDDQALLKIMLWYWEKVFQRSLPRTARTNVSQAIAARNLSAHPTAKAITKAEAASHLASLEQLLQAIGDAPRASHVRKLRDGLGKVDTTSDEAVAARDEFREVESRILEQITREFQARADAGKEAGRQLAQAFQETRTGYDTLLAEVREIKALLKGPTTAPETPPQPVATPEPELQWEVRKNPGGSYSAWAMTRQRKPRLRLAFQEVVLSHLIGETLALRARNAGGRWVPIDDPQAAAKLESEAQQRLIQNASSQ